MENFDYYETQRIKAKLPHTYVLPQNYTAAQQWCYNKIGPIWYFIPENMFDPLLGTQYDLFWLAQANTFYFKDPQLAARFKEIWGSTLQ